MGTARSLLDDDFDAATLRIVEWIADEGSLAAFREICADQQLLVEISPECDCFRPGIVVDLLAE